MSNTYQILRELATAEELGAWDTASAIIEKLRQRWFPNA